MLTTGIAKRAAVATAQEQRDTDTPGSFRGSKRAGLPPPSGAVPVFPLSAAPLSEALMGLTHLAQNCPLGLYNIETIVHGDGTRGMVMRLSHDAEEELFDLVDAEHISDELLAVFRIFAADFLDVDRCVDLCLSVENRELLAVVEEVIHDLEMEIAWDESFTPEPVKDAASGEKRARAPLVLYSIETLSRAAGRPDIAAHSIHRRLQNYVRAFIARSTTRHLPPTLIPAIALPLVHEKDSLASSLARCTCCSLFENNVAAVHMLVCHESRGGASDELFASAIDAGFFGAQLTSAPLALIASLATLRSADPWRVNVVHHLITTGKLPVTLPVAHATASPEPAALPEPTEASHKAVSHADDDTEPETHTESEARGLLDSSQLPTPTAARSLWGGSATPSISSPPCEAESVTIVAPQASTVTVAYSTASLFRSRVCENSRCLIV